MSEAIIIRGGGKQGSVIYDALGSPVSSEQDGRVVLVWDDGEEVHPLLASLPRFWPEKMSLPSDCRRVSCYVAVGSGRVREQLVESVRAHFEAEAIDVQFPSIVHPTAHVSPSATLGEGCFVGPLALVHTSARVGRFVIVNSGSLVEHDCNVGDFCSLNPGSMIMGSVELDRQVTLGSNSSVRDNCNVGATSLVGMGAAIVRSVDSLPGGFWAGVPAAPKFALSRAEKSQRIRWCFKKPFSSDRFLAYLGPSLAQGHVTNDGPLQAVTCRKLQEFIGTSAEILLATSGTAALHALAAGLSIREGRTLRWVTQAFTFPSSIQGPFMNTLVADIDINLHGPSMDFLNTHMDQFDGIVVTNVFGLQTEALEYERWCDKNGKFLLFDNAATPIGTVGRNRCIHEVGHGAIVSFHETKPIGRGEGGAIIVKRELRAFVHQAMNFGFDVNHQIRVANRLSSNWRMSDFAAAALCDHIDYMIENNWKQRLNDKAMSAVKLLQAHGFRLALPMREPTILSCLMVVCGDSSDSSIICRKLNSMDIEAKTYYRPLAPIEEAPLAWQLYQRSICLPFHLEISTEQIERMVVALKEAIE